MALKRRIGIVATVFVLFMCVSVYSAWTEPIHLSELNTIDDMGNIQVATKPNISSDGLFIFFVRQVPFKSEKYYVFEANRDSQDDIFGSPRILNELGSRGNYIASPWISYNGLRLYYAQVEYYQGNWHRFIRMATRENLNSPQFSVAKKFTEIHPYTVDTSPSLTTDELNILWNAYNSGVIVTYSASRSSINDSFSNILPVTELDEIGAVDPYMSADGLSVYFTIAGDNGLSNIWKGGRDSLDAPFGEFKCLSDVVNLDGIYNSFPCISPDGSTLYFNRGHRDMEPSKKGIYVSYWVETPLETAVKNIRKAIVMKKMAIRKINASIAPETKAIHAMEEILKNRDLHISKRRDTMKSKMILEQGIKKQIMAKKELYAKIEILKLSIELLLREKTDNNNGSGNGRRPRTPIQFSKPRPTVGPKIR